ncbi:hypothetical protein [Altererythrobacter sp. GH1-8]|uniref:hypothetical protein n=1 Tax=Altererythrobacter sp. GH1-8 TaxID=3349333 RepID=UPI00374D187D
MKTLDAETYRDRRSALLDEIEKAENGFRAAALVVALGEEDDSVQAEYQNKLTRLNSQIEALDAAREEATRIERIAKARQDRERWDRELAEIDKLYRDASKQAERVEGALRIIDIAIENAAEIQTAVRAMSTRWRGDRSGLQLIDFHGHADRSLTKAKEARETLAALSNMAGDFHSHGVGALSSRQPMPIEEMN